MTGGSGRAVVFGTDPIAADDIDAAKEADLVLFYSFADACDLERDLGYRGEVIDLSDRIRDVEALAGSWAVSLSATLKARVPWLSNDLLYAARRRLHVDVFWPIAVARAKADMVRKRIADPCDIRALAVSRLEKTALAVGCPDGHAESVVPVPDDQAHTAEAAGDAREESLRLKALASDVRAMRLPGCPTAALIVAVPVHFKLLESTIEALKSRGWRCVAVHVATRGGDLAAEAERYGVEYVRLTPFMPRVETARQSLSRRMTEPFVRGAVAAWARANEMAEHTAAIRSGLKAELDTARAFRAAHDVVLRSLRPQVVVSTSELYPGVEPVVGVARRLGVPTVHVQHGNIPEIARMFDFRFDVFCVFGEAYKEALVRLGTSADRIEITGSPYMDTAPLPSADRSSPVALGVADRQTDGNSCYTILFVAGYQTGFSSDAILYESLKMVLEYLESAGDVRLIVKMHPAVSDGRSVVAYETALAEHPNAAVTVVKEGDAHDMIRECDCVTTRGSTVAFEAAWLRKPVILLSPLGSQDHLPLVSEGTAVRARNAGEFAERVRELRDGPGIPSEAYDSVERRYAFAPDGRAGERIVDICERLAAGRKSNRA